jgi:hypothetical protein
MSELADMVAALADDPDRGLGRLGTRPREQMPTWPHVALHPLSLDALEIVETREAEGAARVRWAELWVGLAQAALQRDGGAPHALETREPAVLARAIDDHQRVEAYDQVIVGYLLQIAEELREAGGPDAVELRHRVSALVSAMRPDTLRRLLDMGGEALQRQQFVRNAAAGMTGGAVVDLVQAAAEAAGETVSKGLVRLLSKLAAHADTGRTAVRPLADSALRLQVERLVDGWALPNPNPSDYTNVLDRIAHAASPLAPEEAPSTAMLADPLHLVEMCLELDAEGPVLWRAIDALADQGKLAGVIDVLERTSDSDGLVNRVWSHVASAGTVRRLVARVPPDFAPVDRLLVRLHGDALAPLFDLLVDSDDRHVRRAVFDRLRRVGEADAAEALARMGDDRWYVLRNLLALLADLERLPADCDPSPWLTHADARVRREALRVALRLDALRDAALSSGLADDDHRVLRVAVTAALDRCPPVAARRLVHLVGQETLADDLRAVAVEALARATHGPHALHLLLRIASRDGRLRRGPTLAPKSATVLAALAALAGHWPRDPRAAAVVRRAAESPDPDIRSSVAVAAP